MSQNRAVVILAGGQGRRIGGAKPLQLLGGERLIDRALGQARQWSDLVAISVRNAAQVGDVNVEVLIDEPAVDGPFGGLVTALKFAHAARRDLLLTIPADTPFLPVDLSERLTLAMGDCEAALASSGGRLHPICGAWRTSALGKVDEYLASGRRSLKGFAELIGFTAADWPTEPIDPFFNVNTRDDLRRAAELL